MTHSFGIESFLGLWYMTSWGSHCPRWTSCSSWNAESLVSDRRAPRLPWQTLTSRGMSIAMNGQSEEAIIRQMQTFFDGKLGDIISSRPFGCGGEENR